MIWKQTLWKAVGIPRVESIVSILLELVYNFKYPTMLINMDNSR